MEDSLASVARGLLDALPRCSHCAEPATRAFERGADRFCDTHGGDAPEYPRAPWVRRLQMLLAGRPPQDLVQRAYSLNHAWLLIDEVTRDGIRCPNLRRVILAQIEHLERLVGAAALPGDPDQLLRAR